MHRLSGKRSRKILYLHVLERVLGFGVLAHRLWLTLGCLNQIAKTFIWQPNPADAKKCKILAGLAKVGIAVAFAAIGAIPGLGPAAEGAAVAGGTAAAAGAAAKTASTAKMVSVSADQANTATLFVSFLYIIASIEDDVDRDPR